MSGNPYEYSAEDFQVSEQETDTQDQQDTSPTFTGGTEEQREQEEQEVSDTTDTTDTTTGDENLQDRRIQQRREQQTTEEPLDTTSEEETSPTFTGGTEEQRQAEEEQVTDTTDTQTTETTATTTEEQTGFRQSPTFTGGTEELRQFEEQEEIGVENDQGIEGGAGRVAQEAQQLERQILTEAPTLTRREQIRIQREEADGGRVRLVPELTPEGEQQIEQAGRDAETVQRLALREQAAEEFGVSPSEVELQEQDGEITATATVEGEQQTADPFTGVVSGTERALTPFAQAGADVRQFVTGEETGDVSIDVRGEGSAVESATETTEGQEGARFGEYGVVGDVGDYLQETGQTVQTGFIQPTAEAVGPGVGAALTPGATPAEAAAQLEQGAQTAATVTGDEQVEEAATELEGITPREGQRTAALGEGLVGGALGIANVPAIAGTTVEGAELGAKAVEETAAGRGGEFVGDVGAAATVAGARATQAAVESPTQTAGMLGGGLISSAGIIGGARALGGARAGRAASVAIQPGEEAAIALGTRVPSVGRAAARIPGTGVRSQNLRGAARTADGGFGLRERASTLRERVSEAELPRPSRPLREEAAIRAVNADVRLQSARESVSNLPGRIEQTRLRAQRRFGEVAGAARARAEAGFDQPRVEVVEGDGDSPSLLSETEDELGEPNGGDAPSTGSDENFVEVEVGSGDQVQVQRIRVQQEPQPVGVGQEFDLPGRQADLDTGTRSLLRQAQQSEVVVSSTAAPIDSTLERDETEQEPLLGLEQQPESMVEAAEISQPEAALETRQEIRPELRTELEQRQEQRQELRTEPRTELFTPESRVETDFPFEETDEGAQEEDDPFGLATDVGVEVTEFVNPLTGEANGESEIRTPQLPGFLR